MSQHWNKAVVGCPITVFVQTVADRWILVNAATAMTKKKPPLCCNTETAKGWKVNRQTHIPPPILTNEWRKCKYEV